MIVDNAIIENYIGLEASGKLAGYKWISLIQDGIYQTNSGTYATIAINTLIPTVANLAAGIATVNCVFAAIAAGTTAGTNYTVALSNNTDAAVITGTELTGSGTAETVLTSSEVALTAGKCYRFAARKDSGGGFVELHAAFLLIRCA